MASPFFGEYLIITMLEKNVKRSVKMWIIVVNPIIEAGDTNVTNKIRKENLKPYHKNPLPIEFPLHKYPYPV